MANRIWSVNKISVGENLFYAWMWIAIFFVPLLNAAMTSQAFVNLGEVLEAWYKITPYFLLFLLNNNVLAPRYLLRKKYMKYLLLNFIVISLVFKVVDYMQANMLEQIWSITERVSHSRNGLNFTFTDLSIYGNITFAIFMNAANAGIKLIYKSMDDDKKMEALKQQNMQIEMDYLKYQINPHFFMNTLNNIHALIDIDAESAKRGVIELSKMMRYVLYKSNSESISLDTDVEFIRNYIELMRIRFDGDIDIEINTSPSIPRNTSIPPLLLIVFVENAFKHGMGGEQRFVRIDIDLSDGELHCKISNSIGRKADKSPSGIGLLNVRKRLELLYGANFTLTTKRRERDYFVDLIIPICEL